MPRQARTISATNVYHAILRGVNKQQVFEDDEDYIRFLNVLRRQTQFDVDAQGLTGVPYSIVQRATSDAVRYGSMVCESLPGNEDFETYIDDSEYEKYSIYERHI